MPNTYCQLYVHLVFAVRYREEVIQKIWKDELYKYITGTVQANGHKMICIGGTSDHVHIFVSMSPKQDITSLVSDIKRSSSLWINQKRLVKGKFAWQTGYGAFTNSKSQMSSVVDYISRQEEHHHKQTFIEEYKSFLAFHEISYDERFLFQELE